MCLAIERFSFSLDGRRILRGIDLEVGKHECVAVIGPNGAGKSTLLKCVCRIYPVCDAGSGRICMDGRDVLSYTRRDLARRIGYVPQLLSLYQDYRVDEFVSLSRYPYLSAFGGMRASDTAAVEEAMDVTGIQHLKSRLLTTLSGGERQKVVLASALAQRARLLLLDEPTSYLDPGYRKEMMSLFRKLRRERVLSMLLVTHDLNSLWDVADRIVGIRDGCIRFAVRGVRALDAGHLQDLYDTEFECCWNHDHTRKMFLQP